MSAAAVLQLEMEYIHDQLAHQVKYIKEKKDGKEVIDQYSMHDATMILGAAFGRQ